MGKEREKYLNEEGQLSRKEMTSSKTMLSFKELALKEKKKGQMVAKEELRMPGGGDKRTFTS